MARKVTRIKVAKTASKAPKSKATPKRTKSLVGQSKKTNIPFLDPKTIIISLSGPLSSGCSTIAEHLASLTKDKFVLCRLSDIIRKELKKDGNKNPSPEDLQDKGNELRESKGKQVLVERCLKKCMRMKERPERIVIDGIRNHGEVTYLRSFSKFFLVATDASRTERLKRFRNKTAQQISDIKFNNIDERDSGIDEPEYGQKVTDCVDLAD